MIVAKSRYGYWAAIAGLMFALTPADPIFAQEAPTASGLEEITVTARAARGVHSGHPARSDPRLPRRT